MREWGNNSSCILDLGIDNLQELIDSFESPSIEMKVHNHAESAYSRLITGLEAFSKGVREVKK
jgi:hypothetical protein